MEIYSTPGHSWTRKRIFIAKGLVGFHRDSGKSEDKLVRSTENRSLLLSLSSGDDPSRSSRASCRELREPWRKDYKWVIWYSATIWVQKQAEWSQRFGKIISHGGHFRTRDCLYEVEAFIMSHFANLEIPTYKAASHTGNREILLGSHHWLARRDGIAFGLVSSKISGPLRRRPPGKWSSRVSGLEANLQLSSISNTIVTSLSVGINLLRSLAVTRPWNNGSIGSHSLTFVAVNVCGFKKVTGTCKGGFVRTTHSTRNWGRNRASLVGLFVFAIAPKARVRIVQSS